MLRFEALIYFERNSNGFTMASLNPAHWLLGGLRPNGTRLARWRGMARRIVHASDQLQKISEDELTRRGREIQWKAKAGTPLKKLLPDAYALVRESASRELGMRHFPVQVMGAIGLFEGCVVEMQTGEGKTLTATCLLYTSPSPRDATLSRMPSSA